jgi:mRNA-degrading endonuclease toxin of MazEF toxin-antitoxin module
MLSCGDTFYACDSEDDEPHLNVIITSPEEGEVITVPITTKRHRSETLVQLNVGDHPFIKWQSVVSYYYARIRSVDEIETAINARRAKKMGAVTDALLRRIRMGLRDSDFTPNGVRHYYNALGIED